MERGSFSSFKTSRKVKLQEEELEERSKSGSLQEIVSLVRPEKLSWRFWVYRFFSLQTLKVALYVIVAITAAIVFTLVEEDDGHLGYLAGLSSEIPKHYHFERTSEIIEFSISAQKTKMENHTLSVYLEGMTNTQAWHSLSNWSSILATDTELSETEIFDLYGTDLTSFTEFQITLKTNSFDPLAVIFDAYCISNLARYQVIFAAIILVLLYVLIIFELMHRTVAAMMAAFVALGTLSNLHKRPSFETVVSWIDYETIGLLFGMMLMVGIFSTTGFFEWAAVKAYKISKGNLWHLTLILCFFTCVVSAFLDNVTTILLVAPVTVKLCKVLDLEPTTMVLAEVIFSNVGGTATIIGDPPNIILGTNPEIQKYINFATFSLHVAPGIILCILALVAYVWKVYANSIHRDPTLHLKNEVAIWKKTLSKFKKDDPENPEEAEVFVHLQNFIQSLEEQIRNHAKRVLSESELEDRYQIRDWPLLIKSCVVLSMVIILFFLHSLLHLELSLAWIAIIGAMVHILVSGITNIEEILEKVEFGTLMFFAALFILMQALEDLGLIKWIGQEVITLISLVPAGQYRLLVAILLIIWVSAFASAFIDNIPYTATLAPVIVRLAKSNLGLPLTPLVYALSLGTCLGGNGTLIGASANVVAVGLVEQQGYRIKFLDFFKMGMPVMILTTFVASIYLCITHVLIPWYE